MEKGQLITLFVFGVGGLMIFRSGSRGIFMIELAQEIIYYHLRIAHKTTSKHEKNQSREPVSSLVPVCYLDTTRNILLKPNCLTKQANPPKLFGIHERNDVGSAPCAGHGGHGSCGQKW